MESKVRGKNPLIGLDYPDIDVIRVDDTYYMVSTTMYFMPGCVILRSYDLINWEIASYVYDTLDDTDAQKLTHKQNIYGQGMWAASIRYHKGTFYVCFVANDTHKTYLYQSKDINGPWKKQYIEGFYHDCSLLFDDDDRVYIVYGNKQIHLTELNESLTGPKEGGLNRIIVEDVGNNRLGYEGSHLYKINGRYYVFFIHSLKEEWYRTEACFWADSLTDEFVGGDVLKDDMGHRYSGVAQGGIVDTPDGKWYAILFQDRGAVGRIPVLIPMHWEDKKPVIGIGGKIPKKIETTSTRPDYLYEPLYVSDDFLYEPDEKGKIQLHPAWQWNHNPKDELWSVTEKKGTLRLHSGKICDNLLQAYNTLTQRMAELVSMAEVEIDASGIKEGDYAGICSFIGCYSGIAMTLRSGQYELVVLGKEAKDASMMPNKACAEGKAEEYISVPATSKKLKLRVVANFKDGRDDATYYYQKDHEWIQLGEKQKLFFKLDLFTGCRFGLFYYSTQERGGYVDFSHFNYQILER